MTSTTVLDQIEIRYDGLIQLRFALQVINEGVIVASLWHRTIVLPGGDIDAQVAAVNAHIQLMGRDQITDTDVNKIKAHAALAWTPDAVKSYQDAAEAAQLRATITASVEASKPSV